MGLIRFQVHLLMTEVKLLIHSFIAETKEVLLRSEAVLLLESRRDAIISSVVADDNHLLVNVLVCIFGAVHKR